MKRRSLLLAAGGLSPLLGVAMAAPTAAGQPVAWPEVRLLDGGSFGARQAEGHAMVVVFWSVTCPFCRRHNQHVEKLHRQARGRALKVLTVSRDRNPADLQRYVQQQGYTFPITLDHALLSPLLASRNVIPLTVTVTRKGLLDKAYPGEMFEEDVLELLQLAA